MVNKPASSTNMPLPAKKTHHRDDLPVAILAAGLVRENDLVFDNGPEMPLVISMIPDDITFTGICYSHRVFIALNEKPNATAILCGGTYRAKSDAFMMPIILRRWIRSIRAKCLFPPAAYMNILA